MMLIVSRTSVRERQNLEIHGLKSVIQFIKDPSV
jgi:hypothetical protein